ncbi:MAG: glycosyltransferase family 2 protein, partial [Stenotrophobium sp.]
MPFYNHAHAIARTVDTLRPFGLPCWIVDDGSDASCAPMLDALAAREAAWLHLIRYQPNRGKGVAVMAGCAAAFAEGYTHAAQVDADGQHDAADIPKLLALAQSDPQALVTGVPVYDSSVPKGRLY